MPIFGLVLLATLVPSSEMKCVVLPSFKEMVDIQFVVVDALCAYGSFFSVGLSKMANRGEGH